MTSQTLVSVRPLTYVVGKVPGAKRVSSRPYTHAAIGRSDGELSAATMTAAYAVDAVKAEASEREYWANQKLISKLKEGQLFKNEQGWETPAQKHGIATAKDYLKMFPTADASIAVGAANREKSLAESRAMGLGPLRVLRWSMSEIAAKKSLVEFGKWHSELSIVKCTVKPAKKFSPAPYPQTR